MAELNNNHIRRPWQNKREKQSGRKKRTKLYDSTRWRKIRKLLLMNEPLCRECYKNERVTAAQMVDHIIPFNSGLVDFFNIDNLQPLCNSCHAKKSAKEGGALKQPLNED